MKEHLAQVYGRNSIASIGTVGVMKTKSALKDLARLYEVPMEEINAVTAEEMCAYTDDDENPLPLDKLKQMFPGLNALLRKYPQMGGTFEKLRGSITSWGRHAGGVLITDFDLTRQIPVRKDSEGRLVTCWQEGIAARELGRMGFVKFDILAIDQLNIFEDTLRLIRETTGKDIDVADIPIDDPAAIEQMNRHDTTCIFQFDTDTTDKVISHMGGITKFEDIPALSALMRPAALANRFDSEFGRRRADAEAVYIPDCLKKYIGDTYGLPIYQEHIMQAAMHLAGMDKNDAYRFMKLIYKGKLHDPEEVAEWREKFIRGCRDKVASGEVRAGYPEKLFDEFMAFLGYGFCASHALSYAMYSAVGLWFKAYYPLQFMCANLTATERTSPRLNERVRYCRSRGYRICPPDVRYADRKWIIHDGGLMAPLSGLKGFGANDVNAVLANRPYASVSDFMDRTGLGRAKFETLTLGGALDCFGDREYLYNWYHEVYAKRGSGSRRRMELSFEDVDQSCCFDIKTAFSPKELRTAFEELNGFSLQENLLEKYRDMLRGRPDVRTIGDALAGNTNRHFRMFCRIMSVRKFRSRAGRDFVKIELADGVGAIETIMHEVNYSRHRRSLSEDNVIILPVQLADGGGIYIDDLDRKEVEILES